MASPFPHHPAASDSAPSGEPETIRAVPGNGSIWLLHTGEESAPVAVTVRQGSRRRTRLCIRVRPEGEVELFLPAWAGPEDIRAVLRKRAGWIARHVAAAKARPTLPDPCYMSGEAHPYLGRLFALEVLAAPPASRGKARRQADRQTVRLAGKRLVVCLPAPTPERIKAALATWYAREAARIFARRLAALRPLAPWLTRTPPLRLRVMRRRWGSCSAQGVLTLNTHLVKAPRRCIDYVLAHEAAHLREMNHSPRFYALLGQIMPEWRNAQRELEQLAPLILPRRAPRNPSPDLSRPSPGNQPPAKTSAEHAGIRPPRAFPEPS